MGFILNRIDDRNKDSVRCILLRSVKWYLFFIIIAFFIQTFCIVAYSSIGINPTSITETTSSIKYYLVNGGIPLKILINMVLAGPICEELMFRLGLSINKQSISLWICAVALLLPYYLFHFRFPFILVACGIFAIIVAFFFYTKVTDSSCDIFRDRHQQAFVWISAILFGLAHTTSFTVIKPVILPFIICSITPQFFSGCIITYIRINLNFFSGVIAHVLINSFTLVTMLLLQSN